MNRYSIEEVVEMAVQSERLGYQFYTAMADKFRKDTGLAELFTTLATKEKAHERVFSALKDAVSKDKPEPTQWEDVADYLRAFVQSEFFLGRGKSLPSMEHVKSVREAVDFALGFEKETLLYFIGLRSAVKEQNELDHVINEEKSHIVWLQKFKEKIAK